MDIFLLVAVMDRPATGWQAAIEEVVSSARQKFNDGMMIGGWRVGGAYEGMLGGADARVDPDSWGLPRDWVSASCLCKDLPAYGAIDIIAVPGYGSFLFPPFFLRDPDVDEFGTLVVKLRKVLPGRLCIAIECELWEL